MTIRHDGSYVGGPTTGSAKRPRKKSSPSASEESVEGSGQRQSPTATGVADDDRTEDTLAGPRKLKRSSMAAAIRNEIQASPRVGGVENVRRPSVSCL